MKLVATSFIVLCAEPVSIWIAASKHALKQMEEKIELICLKSMSQEWFSSQSPQMGL